MMPRHTVVRPAGHTFLTNPDGGLTERDTLQCAHCGMHWEVIPGSGRRRGFCTKRMGPTCGKERCMVTCYPAEKRLDDFEAGKLIVL